MIQPTRPRQSSLPRTRATRLLVLLGLLAICRPGAAAVAGISFTKGLLGGTELDQPTSLQFGPDHRLYVAQLDGLIRVYTVVPVGVGNYSVAATETIDLIQSIPNHDDDGTPDPLVDERQITGILVTGDAANPVLYVSSSDPRIGAGVSGSDTNLDTNSGVVSRLQWNGAAWARVDLVQGLPRSEENHGPNGMQLDPTAQVLYLNVGGNTNLGAPSDNFAFLPEYALSAAVLAIDLAAIGNTPYVLPTLDDEDRPGDPDLNDPWGGNDGKNQAMLVPGGPVQIYSAGWRNAYDLVITQAGHMYTIDNGSNGGWGGVPIGEGPAGACTNELTEPGVTHVDGLHHITGPGYYGGHPNPTRANPANTFNPSNPQTPVWSGNPLECDFLAVEGENGSLATFSFSTNGLTEYTASNFAGALSGDLLAAGFGNTIQRIQLSPDGTTVEQVELLFSSVGTTPLDVIAQGDGEIFAGSIWVADFGAGEIVVFEPADAASCTAADDSALDEDGDGFDNADEIDNGTSPCSPADVPPDSDGDGESNLNDSDDDNDGLSDTVDPFAVDPDNGAASSLPIPLSWDLAAGNPGGLLNLGWTGLMSNGVEDYEALFDPAGMTAGGAAGVLSVDLVPEGDATGSANTQQYGFQLGIDVGPTSPAFTVKTRVLSPFAGVVPQDSQSMGLFLGTGDQDDFIKLALVANGGAGGVTSGAETAGSYVEHATHGLTLPGPDYVDLYFRVEPAAGTVQPSYEAVSNAVPGGRILIGGTLSLPASWLTGSTRLAAGILATSAGPGPEFPASWDFFEVIPDALASTAEATVAITPNGDLFASTFQTSAFSVTNDSADAQRITRLTIDLRTALLPDLAYDPDGVAGDNVAKCFDPDSGGSTVGLVAPADPCVDPFSSPHDSGYDVLTIDFDDFDPGESFSFSVDVDPTSIQGSTAPGPNQSGSVSGLELTGSTIHVLFDDDTQLTASPFRVPDGDGGSLATAAFGLPPAPLLEILGTPASPVTVGQSHQTARISGPPGSDFSLLVVEAGLFTAGLPGGGFDLDPFEANSVLFVDEHSGTLDASGIADVPFTLTQFGPDGLNYLVAAFRDAEDRSGPTSPVRVLEYSRCTANAPCDDGNACTDDSCVGGLCVSEALPDGATCDDGESCTATDECSAGACVGILVDTDGDGVGDPCDGDSDGDGVEDDQDCAPSTTTVSAPPGPIGPTLRLDRASVVNLSWLRAPQGHTSNVYRGQVPAAYDPACLVAETPGTIAADPAPIAPGELVYYLVAARNLCGEGSAGNDGQGLARTGWSPCASTGADTDGDGALDLADSCPLIADAGQLDADLDYVGDACDNCPTIPNANQQNADGDENGDICDPCPGDPTNSCVGDTDNDGLLATDPCPADPRNLCFAPVAVDTLTGNPIRLNAHAFDASCSGERIDCNGDTWYADFGYNEPLGASACNLSGGGANCVIEGLPAIFGCEDGATEDLFQCDHWDAGSDPELAYSFDVSDGLYVVNLLFANTFAGTSAEGSRVFDILVEGQPAYDNFDQVAAAGGSGIAVVRSVIATVVDGNGLQIEFGHEVENPAIKAIEILGPGVPFECSSPAECDDGNLCTEDLCSGGSCFNNVLPEGTACDDGDACTALDQCSAGACAGSVDVCSECITDLDCDDGNPCTGNQCSMGLCLNDAAPDGTTCDDGNPCTADQCNMGVCQSDAVPNRTACDDGDPCTGAEQCRGGMCIGRLDDVDGDGAADLCDNCPDSPNAGQEDTDGDGFGDVCDVCIANTDCDDGNSCTQDLCVDDACFNDLLPDGTACDDGNSCTDPDQCSAGVCSGSPDDADGDGTFDLCDNCPDTPNVGQEDTDGDGDGDACDPCPEDPEESCLEDLDQDGLIGAPDPCPTDPRNLCFAPVAVDGLTGNPIRVNANASDAGCAGDKIDCNGQAWYTDFGYSDAFGAATCNLNGGGSNCAVSGLTELFGCEDSATEDLFRCEHWDSDTDPPLAYTFDVPDGEYVVNLFFANTYSGTALPGTRVFDLLIEDQLVYDDFDQVTAAGGSGIAVVRSARVTVADGNGLRIEFGRVLENPAVKAIEILGPSP